MLKKFNIEKQDLIIGFVPLTDSAPLIVARELGIFKKWQLNVVLERQNSWATLRDKLHIGKLDGAQMLAPMPFASSLGLAGETADIITPMILSFNGNAITFSAKVFQEITQQKSFNSDKFPVAASSLVPIINQRRLLGKKLTLATVFPYSCHYYQLVDWLKQSAIAIDDIDIIILPPTSMVKALADGDIDGFCVGGPWNAKAVREKHGVTGLTSVDIWPVRPEKVLGLSANWQANHPNTTLALVSALQEACTWLSSAANRFEAARLMSKIEYLNTNIDVIAPSLLGSCLTQAGQSPRDIPAYNSFSLTQLKNSNCPTQAFGEQILSQMLSAGHISRGHVSENTVSSIYRGDIYHQAMAWHQN